KFNEDKPWKNHSDAFVVTNQERKRYEGLWAANKGLYIDMMHTQINLEDKIESDDGLSAEKDIVSNLFKSSHIGLHLLPNTHPSRLLHGLVVRNLWRRSGLPDSTLKQIWGLVDLRKDGTLTRDEFIVGMWLVDQCLYGKKLPKKLSDELWNSVTKFGISINIP
ncbi:EH domain-containing protein, partial [Ascoidea rubescens DSM 1968]